METQGEMSTKFESHNLQSVKKVCEGNMTPGLAIIIIILVSNKYFWIAEIVTLLMQLKSYFNRHCWKVKYEMSIKINEEIIVLGPLG